MLAFKPPGMQTAASLQGCRKQEKSKVAFPVNLGKRCDGHRVRCCRRFVLQLSSFLQATRGKHLPVMCGSQLQFEGDSGIWLSLSLSLSTEQHAQLEDDSA
jgi:hypothetical protein